MWSLNLRTFWGSISRDKWLLLSILIGFVLRVNNPTFGSPSLFISNDEAVAHLSAWNMLADKTFISIANYTPLFSYIQIPFILLSFAVMKILRLVGDLAEFEFFVLTHEGYFLFIPRLLSGLFSTLAILVIYKITRVLFERKAIAIIASFLTAFSFNLVHISHFGRPWSTAMLFAILSVYLVLKNKNFASFIALGISYGFHQMGILILPLILFLSFKKRGSLSGFIIFTFMVIVLSYLTLRVGLLESVNQNQSFLKLNTALTDLLSGHFSIGSIFNTLSENLIVYFFINLLVTDIVILIFAIWGVYASVTKDHIKNIFVLYFLAYIIFASLFFHPLVRYIFPFLILLIPFSAFGIYRFIFDNRVINFGRIGSLILVIFILVSGIHSIWWNILYTKTPTFVEAHHFINENIFPEVPIAYIGGRYQTFSPSKESIMRLQMADPNYYMRLGSIISEGDFDNVRNIIFVSKFLGKNKTDQLRNAQKGGHILYVVDYYLDPKESIYNLQPGMFELAATFNPTTSGRQVIIPEPLFDASWNFMTNDFRPKVSMYSLDRIGPYIDILKIKNNLPRAKARGIFFLTKFDSDL